MPSPLPRRLAACVLALAAAAVLPAGAGVPLRDGAGHPMRWSLEVEQPNVKGGRITWYLDPLTSQEELPGDVTERVAIMDAAASWETSPGSGVRLLEDPSRPAYVRDATDRVNYMGWKRFALSPFTLSATYSMATNGVISDADVIFNDTVEFVKWATTTPGLPGYADVQAVATHELGHVLGLDHSPVATSTMSWLQSVGAVSARSLAPDDAGAVLEAYPAVTDASVGSILGTVRIGRRPATRGLPVFALDARTGEALGCSLTGERGTYRIRGLPPGPYRVAAAPFSTLLPFSNWWSPAPTKVLPGFLVEDLPGGGAAPRTVFVRGGFPEVGMDFTVGRYGRRVSAEPDGTPGEARDLPLGGGAAGVFETPNDEDWFRIRPEGTDHFDVRVRSWGLGADADPEVAVLAADGTTVLLYRIDDRPSVDAEAFHGPQGIDRDASITDFAPPGPGDFFVRVRAQPQSNSGSPGCFYLVEAVPSAGVPDPRRTTASLAPSATRAAGGPAPVLTAVPRDWRGDPVGPGASVTALRSDGGAPIALADLGDGTYAGTLPPPGAPGEVRFSLEIAAPRGSALVPDAARLVVAGPGDAGRSTLEAEPRRVEAGGGAVVTLSFTPRDGSGNPLGPGLPVALLFDGPPAGTLGPVADLGDGTYVALLAAPEAPSSARVTATVDGEPAGVSRLVGFGWDLPLVAADLGAAVVEAMGRPGVSKSENREFGRAGEALDGVLAGLSLEDEEAAALAGRRAVAALLRAGSAPEARNLAVALGRRVHGLVDAVVFPSPDPAGQRLLGTAKTILSRGDAALLAADEGRAAAFFVAALRKARPLL